MSPRKKKIYPVRQQGAALRVYNIDELYRLIVNNLTLSDLLQYREVSKVHEAEVYSIFRSRIIKYTAPFFATTESRVLFFDALHTYGSLIVGSVSLAVLSMPSSPEAPNNLNVLATFVHYQSWLDTMLQKLKYTIHAQGPCVGPYAIAGYRHVTFAHPDTDAKITLTFSNRSHVWELLFCAPKSCQWNAIGSGTIICPTVEATSRCEAVMGWWNRDHMYSLDDESVPGVSNTSPFPDIVTVYEDTGGWDRPCGLLCPGRPRYTFGGRGIGVWGWTGLNGGMAVNNDLVSELITTNYRWDLGDRCLNPNCTANSVQPEA
ncbi:hypothetical protein B0H16DRAFT_1728702 [Mycena metata]|uniref:Uncharacterized protein n=1 Tax=Mycena metata TaxID=1033252 RepID=A0AAD7N239_9AGAR|nr:hypothetical protein B0H16DRAFT_1728702 [Mycena metata]